MSKLSNYLKAVGNEILGGNMELERVMEILLNTRRKGNMIFISGNGGSAATASHFVNDLDKGLSMKDRKRFKAIALCDSVPIMTALGNDISYGDIFVEQLKNFVNQGDIFIGISGSGNSENVVKAAQYAKNKGCTVISFTGIGGGKVKNYSDICCMTKTNIMEQIEDMHMIWVHSLIYTMRNVIMDEKE
ncbi:SIS domain-containing protein [Clostridium psychrophilum]|uniref:SIS domain-containing protein n=1 Tax=Clostridium psychrophilum TaxID=132926 RepID=UPI001C0AF3E2|nr:SIS domain-containing protein [Clostridium psychrophilum]MBU3181692.1 SIS domain-containing protein [Clostridium psychrophilum]